MQNGSSLSHVDYATEFTIKEPGFYDVAFHGTVGPVSGVTFPLTVALHLEQNGTEVPGTAVQHTFHTSSDTSNVAFTQIIEVTDTPVTLKVIGTGVNYFYSPISMAVQKIGDVDTEE